MKQRLIAHAAEAKVYLQKNKVIKHRIQKSYRYPILDEKIRKQRTRKEARILQKLSSIIPVPALLKIDESLCSLELSYIKGEKLVDILNSHPRSLALCLQLGTTIAKLHDANIVHGDLTTSNVITKKVLHGVLVPYIIDFGLSFDSNRVEDKAVDIHVFKEALQAKHFKKAKSFFHAFLKGYKASISAPHVLQRLSLVEKRGRYKRSY